MAPTVYDGAPTVQRHYNAAGELVGITETDSPWDETARDEAEALYEAERLVCPACGNLREDCGNPDLDWYPQRHICFASKAKDGADRIYGEKHKDKPFHDGSEKRWAKDYAASTPFHFRDGVRVWVSRHDLTPDDTFI